jgi:predicted dehydrogenase
MPDRLRTVLVGFGRIAAGYARDARMARWFPFATHAQVLRAHTGFEWMTVVDPDPVTQVDALRDWGVEEVVSELDQLADPELFEVAVLATPPDNRLGILERLPNLRAVIVEKPLGSDLDAARAFLAVCAARDILVQVNFPRRGDGEMRRLAASLPEDIGRVQAAFALYGNGLNNNGSHIVDWARMFLGEVAWVRAIAEGPVITEGPIPGDTSIPFVLGMANCACLMAQPLNFKNYRENSLDIWGERGRLSFWQEGLTTSVSPRVEHRFLEEHSEIASDAPYIGQTGQGAAMFELYENLFRATKKGEHLWSSGQSALRIMEIVAAIRRSFAGGGKQVEV